MLTLADVLAHARRHHPRSTAVIDGAQRLDYAHLCERVDRLARALRARGLNAGDRVAVLASNGHRYVEAFCGIPSAGMIVVPLNTRLAEAELKAILQDSGARVLLCDRDPGALAACVEQVIALPDAYEAALDASASGARGYAGDESAVAALFYTGGTTGTPKGVMLSHRNLVANAFHKTIACSLTRDDVFLAAPAMFHVAGIAPLVSLLWLGATTVTMPSFEPAGCLELIERHAITVFMPVPTMVAALVAEQRRAPRNASSLRMLGHAGSPIATELIEAAHATFPRAELAQFYGATETASIVTCLRDEQAAIGGELLGSCGRAVIGVSLKTVRADGSACAPGEVGEIWVRGANVMPGYFRNAEASAAALEGGYYHTGDLGFLREDGHLFIVDRLKDMIVSGAENVYSIEVENALYKHPAVREAAVFGVPDAKWGEAVHAVVVIGGDAVANNGGAADAALDAQLEEQLKAHCRASIAGYKVPKRIDVQRAPLPKSGPGKILKRVLRAPFWQKEHAIS
jgi:long-chain acyl-CoA synthetase